MKLSIIVPIYNTEKYLRKCVDSILAQTLTDFECILVDDGSTDNCPAICDEYAEKDPRIVVIHKPNGGQSDARNKGLDIARGDYIGFVDSDDFINENMYRDLFDSASENEADMVCCGYVDLDEEDEILYAYASDSGKKELFLKNEILHDFFNKSLKIAYGCVNKIYTKKLFSELRFPKGMIYEDAFTLPDLIEQCTKIIVLDKNYYYYRSQRPNSTMNTPYNYRRTLYMDLYSKMITFFEERNIESQRNTAYSIYLQYYIQNHIKIYTEFKQYKKQFHSYVKQAKKQLLNILTSSAFKGSKKLCIICLATFASANLGKKLCLKWHPEVLLVLK